MDLLLPIFQLIYFILHFLYSLAQAVFDCFHELYHIVTNLVRWRRHFVLGSKQLLQDASKLKKLPRHLGLILISKQTTNLKHFCYLINWSTGFGIHHLSLYDIEGMLKLKLPSLLDAISQTCVDVTVKVIVDGQVYVRDCGSVSLTQSTKSKRKSCKNMPECDNDSRVNSVFSHDKNASENTTNGYSVSSTKSFIIINILCPEDGKEDLVRLTRKSFNNQELSIDTEYVNDNLITKGQVDPDLLVIIGRPICSLGFLPWQIRLTEFLSIPSLSRLDYFEFRKLLQIYSKCEQRLGS